MKQRVVWNYSGTSKVIAIFRDSKLEEIISGYNDRVINLQMILSDPDGFAKFAQEVKNLCMVNEVKERMRLRKE